ncbi:MAG: hypothetical protein H2069_00405 [Legionella sp.]|nr:hypothetical protein [Legionella sp.]
MKLKVTFNNPEPSLVEGTDEFGQKIVTVNHNHPDYLSKASYNDIVHTTGCQKFFKKYAKAGNENLSLHTGAAAAQAAGEDKARLDFYHEFTKMGH